MSAADAAAAAAKAGNDEQLLRRAAKGTLCDVLLSQAADCMQRDRWDDAIRFAKEAQQAAAGDAERCAQAAAALDAAHGCACDAQLAASAAAVQRGRWCEAKLQAHRACDFVHDDASRGARVAAALTTAEWGPFKAAMANAQDFLERGWWVEAMCAAQVAVTSARDLDAAAAERAAGALQAARLGCFQARMAAAEAALQHSRWSEAQASAEAAQLVAPDDASVARVAAVLGAVRRGAFDERMACSAQAEEDRRWAAAADAAEHALECADDDEQKGLARAAATRAHQAAKAAAATAAA